MKQLTVWQHFIHHNADVQVLLIDNGLNLARERAVDFNRFSKWFADKCKTVGQIGLYAGDVDLASLSSKAAAK